MHQLRATLQPRDAIARGMLGFSLLKQGRYMDALEALEGAERLEGPAPTSTTVCGKAAALTGLGRLAEAERAMRSASKLEGGEGCAQSMPGLVDAARHGADLMPEGSRELLQHLQRAWASFAGESQ